MKYQVFRYQIVVDLRLISCLSPECKKYTGHIIEDMSNLIPYHQEWPGRNRFFLNGRLITGPDVHNLMLTGVLIIVPVLIFISKIVPNLCVTEFYAENWCGPFTEVRPSRLLRNEVAAGAQLDMSLAPQSALAALDAKQISERSSFWDLSEENGRYRNVGHLFTTDRRQLSPRADTVQLWWRDVCTRILRRILPWSVDPGLDKNADADRDPYDVEPASLDPVTWQDRGIESPVGTGRVRGTEMREAPLATDRFMGRAPMGKSHLRAISEEDTKGDRAQLSTARDSGLNSQKKGKQALDSLSENSPNSDEARFSSFISTQSTRKTQKRQIENGSQYLKIVPLTIFLVLVTLIAFVQTALTDPGIIPRDSTRVYFACSVCLPQMRILPTIFLLKNTFFFRSRQVSRKLFRLVSDVVYSQIEKFFFGTVVW